MHPKKLLRAMLLEASDRKNRQPFRKSEHVGHAIILFSSYQYNVRSCKKWEEVWNHCCLVIILALRQPWQMLMGDSGCFGKLSNGEHCWTRWQLEQPPAVPESKDGEGRLPALLPGLALPQGVRGQLFGLQAVGHPSELAPSDSI